MRAWYSLFLLILCLFSSLSWAQIAPLPVDENTVALWNFDTDVDADVFDIAPSPMNGISYTTENVAVPNIDPSFQLGRKFTGQSSFIDLGVTQGSKINFAGWNELAIEAVISLNQSATGDHVIFSSENVRLMVINNQLAGVVRQPGGLFGVVSDRTLALSTIYRVGLHFKSRTLVLSINGRVDSSIKVDHDIQSPIFSSSRASIGGDIFAQYFPGYVDDVRVRNVADIDMQGPGITLVEPATFQVSSSRPNFLINLSDDLSGVDVSSIEVLLNGIPQPSLIKNENSISGFMDDELLSTMLNEVKVKVTDNQGNMNEKSFFFTFSSIFDRQEYVTDSHTLALWHMNDYAPGFLKDDSGFGRDGYGDPRYVQVADGVFGQARQFIRGGQISFDSIRFTSKKFTLEAWVRPTSNYSSEEVLFYNGQIKILRWNGGYIRTVLYTTRGEKSYQSSDLLLPVNELHHIAVTWDGTKASQNINFYVDGNIRGKLDAVSDCDFDPIPKVGLIGPGFEGLIEEMRFSDSVRMGFNVPIFDNLAIQFLNLKNGTSTNESFPVFHATLNASSEIDVNTVKILLNGNLEVPSSSLIVTSTGIDGTFSQALVPGMNALEISFRDSIGNQRKKMQYFYYLRKVGGSEYSASTDTAALWHFNEIIPGTFKDSSSNANHITNPGAQIDTGVIGNAFKGSASLTNKLALNCRSYTIESQIKTNEFPAGYRYLYQISNSSAGESLRMNPINGNLLLSIYSTPNTLETEIPAAVPVDNAYHHIAVVYDGNRAHSQLLVVVDGVVKRSMDFHNACNNSGNNSFTIGDGVGFSFDEFRISKTAKYSFNLPALVSDKPMLSATSIPVKGTVSFPTQNFTFSLSDSDGINGAATSLSLNGVEQNITEIGNKKIDLTSSFSSSLTFIDGANLVLIRGRDNKGNDQVHSFLVYLFRKDSFSEYTPDANTVFLYHFNETTGPFLDSASSGINLPESPWTRVSGVLGQGARTNGTSANYTYSNLSSAPGWTLETWKKGTGAEHMFAGSIITSSLQGGKFSTYINGTWISEPTQTITDDLYHHYAVVADKNHPYANLYLLIDGKVVHSAMTTVNLTISSLTGSPGYSLRNDSIDEMRFSKVPRYELRSSQQ